jgi:hypothetical protein
MKLTQNLILQKLLKLKLDHNSSRRPNEPKYASANAGHATCHGREID